MTDDDVTADLLACEIADKVPMELVVHPVTVFQLVGLLQLALRHPELGGVSQAAAQRFISGARQYFFDCPTVLEVIDRGDNPAEDRHTVPQHLRLRFRQAGRHVHCRLFSGPAPDTTVAKVGDLVFDIDEWAHVQFLWQHSVEFVEEVE